MVVLHGPGPKILVKRIQNLDSLVVMFMVHTPLAPLVPVRAVRSAASEAASHPHPQDPVRLTRRCLAPPGSVRKQKKKCLIDNQFTVAVAVFIK